MRLATIQFKDDLNRLYRFVFRSGISSYSSYFVFTGSLDQYEQLESFFSKAEIGFDCSIECCDTAGHIWQWQTDQGVSQIILKSKHPARKPSGPFTRPVQFPSEEGKKPLLADFFRFEEELKKSSQWLSQYRISSGVRGLSFSPIQSIEPLEFQGLTQVLTKETSSFLAKYSLSEDIHLPQLEAHLSELGTLHSLYHHLPPGPVGNIVVELTDAELQDLHSEIAILNLINRELEDFNLFDLSLKDLAQDSLIWEEKAKALQGKMIPLNYQDIPDLAELLSEAAQSLQNHFYREAHELKNKAHNLTNSTINNLRADIEETSEFLTQFIQTCLGALREIKQPKRKETKLPHHKYLKRLPFFSTVIASTEEVQRQISDTEQAQHNLFLLLQRAVQTLEQLLLSVPTKIAEFDQRVKFGDLLKNSENAAQQGPQEKPHKLPLISKVGIVQYLQIVNTIIEYNLAQKHIEHNRSLLRVFQTRVDTLFDLIASLRIGTRSHKDCQDRSPGVVISEARNLIRYLDKKKLRLERGEQSRQQQAEFQQESQRHADAQGKLATRWDDLIGRKALPSLPTISSQEAIVFIKKINQLACIRSLRQEFREKHPRDSAITLWQVEDKLLALEELQTIRNFLGKRPGNHIIYPKSSELIQTLRNEGMGTIEVQISPDDDDLTPPRQSLNDTMKILTAGRKLT